MPNGNMTTKEYVIQLTQKVNDFLEAYKEEKEEHSKEHGRIWKLIIGLPALLVVLFTLVKIFGGSK